MIFTFLDFITESKGLGLPFYFSKKLSDFLFEIIRNTSDKEVIEFLYNTLDQESKESISSNFTFIDMSNNNDTVSFIQSNRVLQIYKESGSKDEYSEWIKYEKVNDKSEVWSSSLRSEARIGKTFKKIVIDGGKKFTDSVIERFVNLYKSSYDFKFNTNGRFELVSGELIRQFYLESRYGGKGGQLSNSCMRYPSCQGFFDLYVENPNVCSMLVLYSSIDREKISGRALIWKCIDGETYIDRVYTNDDSDINLFYSYGKSQGWSPQWNYNRQVQLKKWKFDQYPYMDTFGVLYDNGILFADDNEWERSLKSGNLNVLSLKQTDGTSLDSKYVVWSNYSNQYIVRDEAIYIEEYNDWIYLEEAIYIKYESKYVHPDENLFWSEYYQDYILEKDHVKSKYLSDNIFIHKSEKIGIMSEEGKIKYDFVPEEFKKLIVDVTSYDNNGSEVVVQSLPNFIITNPTNNVNYFLNGDILCYNHQGKLTIKSDSTRDGDLRWVSTQDYIKNILISDKKSRQEVEMYISNLTIDIKEYEDKLEQIKGFFSKSWTPNFRKSTMRNLTDKFTTLEISELIKKCLMNYDLSIKYLPGDISRGNLEINHLLNEFLNRNKDPLSKKMTVHSISKLYLITQYLLTDLIKDKDIMMAWYKEVVFKQS